MCKRVFTQRLSPVVFPTDVPALLHMLRSPPLWGVAVADYTGAWCPLPSLPPCQGTRISGSTVIESCSNWRPPPLTPPVLYTHQSLMRCCKQFRHVGGRIVRIRRRSTDVVPDSTVRRKVCRGYVGYHSRNSKQRDKPPGSCACRPQPHCCLRTLDGGDGGHESQCNMQHATCNVHRRTFLILPVYIGGYARGYGSGGGCRCRCRCTTTTTTTSTSSSSSTTC